MMTVYRELKIDAVETIELDVHLEGCASCRQELARSMFIGQRLSSLPEVEPLPDMHAKLMRALAKEHLEFTKHAVPGTVATPEFLKPYLQEHAQSTHSSDPISAFSTAETGPLPIIQANRKRRPRSHMSQFAVLGLAATFLMVLMMGGLTSLLLLAHNNPRATIPSKIAGSVIQPAIVEQAKYKTTTPYQHVVSAVADHSYIYYTAYEDKTNSTWMLERLDRATNISTPLLPSATANPLIVLGSAGGSLVWLQFDGLKQKGPNNLLKYGLHPYASLWSLHYLSAAQQQQITLGLPTASEILLKGTFDLDTAPSWVTTPVQGIWYMQHSLLVATTDSHGISHLLRYQLDTLVKPQAKEIATAVRGHILTSPTANSDGSQMFWSEEWLSSSETLYSNIWTQQEAYTTSPTHGPWAPHTVITKHLFSSDGMSFRPQVADNTLFMLSTASQSNSTQSTPTSTVTATLTPSPSPSPNPSAVSRTDTSIYAAPLDASMRGSILMFPLDGDPTAELTAVNTSGLASSLQAGAGFALWQGDKAYEMYDVSLGSDVTVGNIFEGSTFLAVNGTTAVWMVNSGSSTTSSHGPSITLMAFNWPAK